MRGVVLFAVIVFGPLVALLFVPAPVIGLNCATCAGTVLLAVLAPESGPSLADAVSYCLWAIAPFVAAGTILCLGGLCRYLYGRWQSRYALWAMAWAIFTMSLFLIAWFLTVIAGSVSMAAADSNGYSFLFVCAGAAGAVTLASQVLVVPWLFVASLIMKSLDPELVGAGMTAAGAHPNPAVLPWDV